MPPNMNDWPTLLPPKAPPNSPVQEPPPPPPGSPAQESPPSKLQQDSSRVDSMDPAAPAREPPTQGPHASGPPASGPPVPQYPILSTLPPISSGIWMGVTEEEQDITDGTAAPALEYESASGENLKRYLGAELAGGVEESTSGPFPPSTLPTDEWGFVDDSHLCKYEAYRDSYLGIRSEPSNPQQPSTGAQYTPLSTIPSSTLPIRRPIIRSNPPDYKTDPQGWEAWNHQRCNDAVNSVDWSKVGNKKVDMFVVRVRSRYFENGRLRPEMRTGTRQPQEERPMVEDEDGDVSVLDLNE